MATGNLLARLLLIHEFMSDLANRLQMEHTIVGVRTAIYSRRATRSYLRNPVGENQVRALLHAAAQAPSAMNSQPWAFVVVQSRDILKRISDEARQHLLASSRSVSPLELGHIPLEDTKFNMFFDAGTLIVVCGKVDPVISPVGDCHLAAENLMLAACELGLATCPIGMAVDTLRTHHWREKLSIPSGYDPILPIVVGYAGPGKSHAKRAPATILSWIR